MPKTFSMPVTVSIPRAGEFTVNLKISSDDLNIPEDVTVEAVGAAALTMVRDRIKVTPAKGEARTLAGLIRAARLADKRESE